MDGRTVKVIRPREYERAGEKGYGEQYAYDMSGRLLTVTQANSAVGEAHTYDESGLVVRTIDGTGNGVHFTYDLGGRRTYAETGGGANQRYEYDAFGNITGIVDGEANRTQYILDEWGRIVEVKRADGVSEFYSYDYAGNLLVDDRAQYAYGAFNWTEKVETFDGHVQVNRYDAEGLRHEMEEDGKLVQFIFRGDEVVAEKTDDNIIRLIRGYDLTASEADWARTYYHYVSDEMGSITHLVEGEEVKTAMNMTHGGT